jgi:hypothetical protein
MPFQERSIFFLKCLDVVVFTLVFHVVGDVRQMRFADGKGPITILPCEPSHSWKRLVNPAGGTSFESLHRFAERQRRRQTQHDMHMILDATDLKGASYGFVERCPPNTPRCAAQLLSQATVVLGTEDDVEG